MRKKVSLILVLILGVVLTATLVACNGSQDIGKLPDDIGPGHIVDGGDDTVYQSYLKFYFPNGAPSVFNALYCDEFDVSEVEYSIVYTNGSVTTEVAGGNLTESMIAKVMDGDEDITEQLGTPFEWRKGHFMVHASATLDNGKKVEGSFALHLKDRYQPAPTVTVTFDLRDNESKAQAYFGKTSDDGTKATVTLGSGITFASWDEFTDAFRMSLDGKALESVTVGQKVLKQDQGFPFVLDDTYDAKTFVPKWTEDTVEVTFVLNVPSDATVAYGCEDPRTNFDSSQTVVRSSGKATAPDIDVINVFNGYYFGGWYLDCGDVKNAWDENDSLWSFSSRVGDSPITLVGRWTVRSYSYTLYTMGGEFTPTVQNSVVNVGGNPIEIDSDEKVAQLGLSLVEASTRFGEEDGKLNRIVFSGLGYGRSFADYVAKIEVEKRKSDSIPAKSVYLKLDEVRANLVKGSADYVVDGGVYRDYQCTVPANMTQVVADGTGKIDDIAYIKWVFNDTDDEQLRLDRLSRYYVNVVFKDGLSINADGSVSIDKIADESLNELVIPAYLNVNGAVRPVTAIGDKACTNLKALSVLDLSEAVNLVSIGEQAFAHCPCLETIIIPKVENVTSVGRDVFYRTSFENNYQQNNGGKEFIVIGKILYKYVGDPSKTSFDLSLENYYTSDNCTADADKIAQFNLQIRNVDTIASGAFANCTALESITLGDNVKNIANYAFDGLENFATLNVGSESKLQYVGEDAFLSSSKDSKEKDDIIFLSESGSCYDPIYGAIIIGKVYYRFIDKDATLAVIDGVKTPYIAPEAFRHRSNVAEVNVMHEDSILTVGKNAFFSTTWIQHDNGSSVLDGYTVINGIFTEYYVAQYSADKVNLIIPDYIEQIGDWAFNTYAQYVMTVQIKANVERINDYAFAGATSLKSLIFSDAAVDSANHKIVGLPNITGHAFANKNGKLIENVRFFFREEVVEFFRNMNAGTVTSDDAVTNNWFLFYKLNSENFVAEDISNVWINPEIISDKLIKKQSDGNAFIEAYGTSVDRALVVVGNTGVVRYETLDYAANEVQLVKVEKGDEKFGYLFEEGVDKYVVVFTYDGKVKGCEINGGDQHLFVVAISSAIDDSTLDNFYKSNVDVYPDNSTVIDATGKNKGNSNFWFEGFEGQVDGADYPTFYMSNTGVSVSFCYKDVDGVERSIALTPSQIGDFNTLTPMPERTATFTVNFHDIGVYKFGIKYAVQESKFKAIEQQSAVSVPLNGNASKYFGNFTVNLVGQDGIKVERELRTANFDIIQVDGVSTTVVNTTKLGMHTLTIRYSKADAAEPLLQTIVYSVILEADADIFGYEIVDERDMTARIVSCSATNADTIVLPTTYTDENGNVYRITQLGKNPTPGESNFKGVFENFTSLKAVYLAANIEYINARTFAGCSLLENVYTVQKVDVQKAQLTPNNFEVLSTRQGDGVTICEVKVANLDGVTLEENVLAIDSQYVVENASGRIVYEVVAIEDGLVLAQSDVEVFLPDTVFNLFTMYRTVATDVYEPIAPSIYSSANGIMFRTAQYVNASVSYIGTSAFENCISLKSIDLSKATGLQYVGSNAFAGSGLESVDLSGNASLQELNAGAFEGCKNLVSVKVCSALKIIGQNCFKNDSALASFTFSNENGLEIIASDAFFGCDEGVVPSTKA